MSEYTTSKLDITQDEFLQKHENVSPEPALRKGITVIKNTLHEDLDQLDEKD